MTDPAANPGQVADEGPARQNEIAETLRKLRKLVIFSGDELTEGLPLYFNSVSLLEELEARVEDARLFLQGQERTARSSGQRQWLARGVSPERAFEMRAARATSWNEFTQAEVDAMTPSMRHAMTTRLATQAAAAAKAKARAEAEEIAKEVSRRKKAEHDAKVAEAAIEDIKKQAAKKKLEVLAAIEEDANAELLRYEQQLKAAKEESLRTAWADAQPAPATSDAASSRDTPAASSNQDASSGSRQGASGGSWPQLPQPTAKSQQRGRDATPQSATATTRQRSKSKGGANKSGAAPEALTWGEIFDAPDTYMRPLRGACQDDGRSVSLASAARNSETAVELFGRTRPPLQARATAYPHGEKQFKLDLSWHGIDRDLWPLSSWNMSLGETGPKPRFHAKGRGKDRNTLRPEAIWQLRDHQEVDQLTEEDRAMVCRPGPPATNRAAWLATELLPRGCYIDFGEATIRTAIGHWDEANAIFRHAR
ncbi:hypothetical protein AK812_SmicGene24189 [Symbiodinium microadriaticum]|uniref:Uncharacterized protein n=1 Tax=Symbiodinium microadriaticum TaxID=2951 RepID=A0A1Q9DFE0_SYMMI|nr:hypothetical protein AK812_SmicGene41367 [Symbiodinium microadriaticum]OLP93859.1 hypothetical protein AK812_SmicGene24189 [Symbiodinium microadriaticum]